MLVVSNRQHVAAGRIELMAGIAIEQSAWADLECFALLEIAVAGIILGSQLDFMIETDVRNIGIVPNRFRTTANRSFQALHRVAFSGGGD